MEGPMCQSCGMPLSQDEFLGTEKDGSKNGEYCIYCYKDGAFAQPDATMEDMIEHCLPFLDDMIKDNPEMAGTTPEMARQQMREYFPSLKRWSAQ